MRIQDVRSRIDGNSFGGASPVNASSPFLPVTQHNAGQLQIAAPPTFGTFALYTLPILTGT
jgi:hypothetical protein